MQGEARWGIFQFIEDWYNPHRRHSGIDYQSPINFERRYQGVAGWDNRPGQKLSTKSGEVHLLKFPIQTHLLSRYLFFLISRFPPEWPYYFFVYQLIAMVL